MKNFDISLYFVTDSRYQDEAGFLHQIEEACAGGATIVQLREKDKTSREYYNLGLKVKAITDKYNLPLIIDDRLDIALVIGAAGVHVGAEDLPVKRIREIAGNDFIIGATAKTVEWALDEENQGADYLGVGAIYPTKTKVKTVLTSVDTLTDIIHHVHIPVLAIGGLNGDNLDVLKGAPINGIAVVRALQCAEDPRKTAQDLLAKSHALQQR